MNELQRELFEKQLPSLSRELEYPRTPDIAGVVMRRLLTRGKGDRSEGKPRFVSRTLAWSLTIILILCSSLMLIPPVRAAVIEFIQIGAVRIFRAEPTLLTPPQEEMPVTATPAITAQPLIPMLERLTGEMTLEEAQQSVAYPILLPSYPSDLGLPDRIFVQEAEGRMTILVWLDPQQPDKILLSLHLIPEGSWAVEKSEPVTVKETTVNGQRAIWAVGPYPLRFSNGDLQFTRLIDGHVLIWAEGKVTYRLESDLQLEEAVKIAGSLKPVTP